MFEKPFEWGNAQFDPETHRQWAEYREWYEPELGHPIEHGLRFIPAKRKKREDGS